MKVIQTLALVVLAGLLTASCRQQDMRTAVIDVPEMHHQMAANRIVFALANQQMIPPARIKVDLERRRLEIRYDSLRHSLKNLEFTIADVGFTANDVPANAAAREALPADWR